MAAAEKQNIPSLDDMKAWAKDQSGKNWERLLSGLTDIFLSDSEANASRYGDDYADIVCRLLEQVDEEGRMELAQRISEEVHYPGRVVLRLAKDEHAVAAPVLEKSPVLKDADLLDVIGAKTSEHSLSISRRKQLGHKITDLLVAHGDPEIVRSMAANPGASFSDKTYRLVAEKAKSDPLLQERLVGRADLTQALAVQIAPFLSEELRGKLQAAQSGGPINAAGKRQGPSLLDSLDEIAKETGSKKNPVAAKKPAAPSAEPLEVNSRLDKIARQMAEADQSGALCIALKDAGRVSEDMVSKALFNRNGRPISVLCRALKLSSPTFEAIARMRANTLGQSMKDVATLVKAYEAIPAAEADTTIKKLQAMSQVGSKPGGDA